MSRISELEKKFIEKLAELEHEQWMQWAQSLVDSENLSEVRKLRWGKLMVPYSQLLENDKERDREWAMKVFTLVKECIDG